MIDRDGRDAVQTDVAHGRAYERVSRWFAGVAPTTTAAGPRHHEWRRTCDRGGTVASSANKMLLMLPSESRNVVALSPSRATRFAGGGAVSDADAASSSRPARCGSKPFSGGRLAGGSDEAHGGCGLGGSTGGGPLIVTGLEAPVVRGAPVPAVAAAASAARWRPPAATLVTTRRAAQRDPRAAGVDRRESGARPGRPVRRRRRAVACDVVWALTRPRDRPTDRPIDRPMVKTAAPR